MTHSRYLLTLIGLMAIMVQAPAQTMPPGLRLWFRADTLTTVTNGAVSRWGSIVGGHVAVAQPGSGLTLEKIGPKAAISFVNSAYFKAPSVFPVQRDYTMYVVFNWNGVHAANNLVSGQNRAFFTSAPGITSVLHAGNFSRLSTSTRALSGPTVLRVRHTDESGQTSISLNNVKASDDNIPSNTDSVVFIGAYAGANGLNGSIGEILLFERNLTEAEESLVETYLHSRYAIPRTPNPPSPVIQFLEGPRSLAVIDPDAGLVIKGIVLSDSLQEIAVELRKDDEVVSSTRYTKPAVGDTITSRIDARYELASYAATVTARKKGMPFADTMLAATDVVPGIVFSVNGQSNSIFGDGSLPVSTWARTFGGNYSQSRADTSYLRSTATGNGGGNNVGAWALGIQNAMAEQLTMPSLCISGGVGGTRIEQHLPDINNRLNLSTIYGSWLYRVIKSGSRERIRWMFWYQGESNHDEDNYAVHFDNLRTAWKKDLPNLRYIVVIQIRPGCAGPRHAQLREDQRQLQNRYPDVIVHAAGGLPGHDGCHYTGIGYATLAKQLFDLYQRNEQNSGSDIARLATMARPVQLVRLPNQKVQRVTVEFDDGEDLIMTTDALIAGSVRVARDAWFANGTASFHPVSVRVEGRIAELVFPFEPPITGISYVPDYTYDDGATVFQGPWLTTRSGVGALSFHNVPMSVTDVKDDPSDAGNDAEEIKQIIDLAGRVVGTTREDLQRLPNGVYILIDSSITRKVLLMR